jgi:anti-anti-sigma factor
MQAIEHGESLVVAVDSEDCASLWRTLEPFLGNGRRRIILDFANVTFINSLNIAQIVALRHRTGPLQAEVRVANLRENIKAVFRILRLDKLFALDLTLETALA